MWPCVARRAVTAEHIMQAFNMTLCALCVQIVRVLLKSLEAWKLDPSAHPSQSTTATDVPKYFKKEHHSDLKFKIECA